MNNNMTAALLALGKYDANISKVELATAKQILSDCQNGSAQEFKARLLAAGVKPDPAGIALIFIAMHGLPKPGLNGAIQTRFPVDVQDSWISSKTTLGSRFPVDVPTFQHGLGNLGNEVWETVGDTPFGGGTTNTYQGTPDSSGTSFNWMGLINQVTSVGVGLAAKYGQQQITQVNQSAQQQMNQMYTQQTGLQPSQSGVAAWANQNPQYAAQAWQSAATNAGMSPADIQKIVDASKPNNTALYAAIGVGGFLLIGGILAAIMISGRNKNAER